ncbi:GNAT family N-acetyltransferase [Bacillus massiliigorillae]|uniref:GNAT family N-acetyltransferase n=1 Tax=Bacillus massiliigorillae TaxID=1243664 RepID=UPI0005A8F98A|nr:GNAT family N-acetyltransferase [Bacillus massiliigorillae]
MNSSDIKLAFYEEKYRERLCSYELDDTQSVYTLMPSEAIARFASNSYSDPVVMLLQQNPIGLFVLHDAKDALHDSEVEHTMLIRSLSVNPKYQGNGFAQTAMCMLPQFVRVHYPHILELFSVVNLGNARAERVYLKAGYDYRGIKREGPDGAEKILHYTLKTRV